MPIDPNIALSVQVPQFANPMQVYAQSQQMALARENAASLREQRLYSEQQRAQETAKLQMQNEDQQAFAQALQQGNGVRGATLDYLMKQHPHAVPLATKYFDDSEKSAADISQLKATVAEKQNEMRETETTVNGDGESEQDDIKPAEHCAAKY